jgi:hypothetical protein
MFCRIVLVFFKSLAEIYKMHFYVMIEYLEVVHSLLVPTYHITGVINDFS